MNDWLPWWFHFCVIYFAQSSETVPFHEEHWPLDGFHRPLSCKMSCSRNCTWNLLDQKSQYPKRKKKIENCYPHLNNVGGLWILYFSVASFEDVHLQKL